MPATEALHNRIAIAFDYDDDGAVHFLKRVITHPEKTRYLRFISQDGHGDVSAARRVQNLAPAGFGEGSELLESLLLAVDSIGKRIALRKLGEGE